MQASPGSIAWVGSSMGGSDHALVEMLGQATGVEPLHVIYVPRTGGGRVAEALLADLVTVGVSGYGEFAPHFESGQLRPLAVASAGRLPGVEVPTLGELGIELVVTNWRGVFAPADLPDERRQELMAMVERMVRSDAWGYVLRKHRWTDFYLPGQEFARFARAEKARARASGGSPSFGSIEVWKPGLRVSLQRDLRTWVDSSARLALLGGVCLSVYKKAGLDGRTDLSAYFLEDLLPPTDARPEVA